ncbi:ABC transporter ATP-binding protein [Gordonia sp. ABSL11-1]|uniref:dipeptide ABC transporter ATP-binding protein n=1 Tax=Gordonia sp. ABSL11-1 TaxID=3053924 RepID=UPI002573E878|nr:ABC transporter ATP-binding protein [Gordonia sp. ABSL11-1]MDL9948120.1 ABC transporter ATP-binding protein [Gordonia sp. ABSL11-1]
MTPAQAPLLEIENLTVVYDGHDGGPAVSSVSHTVAPGEFVAVVGESGSGKSTTVQAALGILPATGRITSGRIRYDGTDVTGWSHRRLTRLRGAFVGYIPQDPSTGLNPVKRVGRQVTEAIRLHHRAGTDEVRAIALDRLTQAGLTDVETVYKRYPHELSGGMRQRVLIAIALANSPKLVVADEPTSALDVTVQKNILDRLATLREELRLGILFVTHDLGIAAERADRIVVMKDGRMVEEGTAAGVLENPSHPYTAELVRNDPALIARRLTPSTHIVSAPEQPAPDRSVLRLDSVSKYFSTSRTSNGPAAVAEVSLELRDRRTHAIVGESGAGKTTLARLAVGLETVSAGQVLIDDEVVSGPGTRYRRQAYRHIQYVYQDPFSSLNPKMSVKQIVLEPVQSFGLLSTRAEAVSRVSDLLDAVGLPGKFADRRPGELSGGQRQRVAIARALAVDPKIVVLDEAVSALDVLVQSRILQLLVDLQAAFGLAYLFITHDIGVVRLIADDISVMRGGRIVESGRAEDILTDPREEYTQQLMAAVPTTRYKEALR